MKQRLFSKISHWQNRRRNLLPNVYKRWKEYTQTSLITYGMCVLVAMPFVVGLGVFLHGQKQLLELTEEVELLLAKTDQFLTKQSAVRELSEKTDQRRDFLRSLQTKVFLQKELILWNEVASTCSYPELTTLLADVDPKTNNLEWKEELGRLKLDHPIFLSETDLAVFLSEIEGVSIDGYNSRSAYPLGIFEEFTMHMRNYGGIRIWEIDCSIKKDGSV